MTNAVKHFKWTPRGKRRLHATPNRTEIVACLPWLEAELARIRPKLVVALGSTAAKTLLGASFSVLRGRGKLHSSPLAPRVVATVHPSSILRAPDDAVRHMKAVRKLMEDAGAPEGAAGSPRTAGRGERI